MNRIRNFVFGVGVLASLGFGAASATAEPVMERRTVCPFTRIYEECSRCCGANGVAHFDGAIGYCGCN